MFFGLLLSFGFIVSEASYCRDHQDKQQCLGQFGCKWCPRTCFLVCIQDDYCTDDRVYSICAAGYATSYPTPYPTPFPTPFPTRLPTNYPTPYPSNSPTTSPTTSPSKSPTSSPSSSPTPSPTFSFAPLFFNNNQNFLNAIDMETYQAYTADSTSLNDSSMLIRFIGTDITLGVQLDDGDGGDDTFVANLGIVGQHNDSIVSNVVNNGHIYRRIVLYAALGTARGVVAASLRLRHQCKAPPPSLIATDSRLATFAAPTPSNYTNDNNNDDCSLFIGIIPSFAEYKLTKVVVEVGGEAAVPVEVTSLVVVDARSLPPPASPTTPTVIRETLEKEEKSNGVAIALLAAFLSLVVIALIVSLLFIAVQRQRRMKKQQDVVGYGEPAYEMSSPRSSRSPRNSRRNASTARSQPAARRRADIASSASTDAAHYYHHHHPIQPRWNNEGGGVIGAMYIDADDNDAADERRARARLHRIKVDVDTKNPNFFAIPQ